MTCKTIYLSNRLISLYTVDTPNNRCTMTSYIAITLYIKPKK